MTRKQAGHVVKGLSSIHPASTKTRKDWFYIVKSGDVNKILVISEAGEAYSIVLRLDRFRTIFLNVSGFLHDFFPRPQRILTGFS